MKNIVIKYLNRFKIHNLTGINNRHYQMPRMTILRLMQIRIEKELIHFAFSSTSATYENFYDIRRINKLIKLYNLNCLQTCDNEDHLLGRIRSNYTLYSYASRTSLLNIVLHSSLLLQFIVFFVFFLFVFLLLVIRIHI